MAAAIAGTLLGPGPGMSMDLTLIEGVIEPAKHETRMERLALIRTFSEGQLIRVLLFRNLPIG